MKTLSVSHSSSRVWGATISMEQPSGRSWYISSQDWSGSLNPHTTVRTRSFRAVRFTPAALRQTTQEKSPLLSRVSLMRTALALFSKATITFHMVPHSFDVPWGQRPRISS